MLFRIEAVSRFMTRGENERSGDAAACPLGFIHRPFRPVLYFPPVSDISLAFHVI